MTERFDSLFPAPDKIGFQFFLLHETEADRAV
jgi:hypothetical protein